MGILDLFTGKTADPHKPKIRSKKDLLSYLKSLGTQEEIANLIADCMERGGRDSYIKFERGGTGNPYQVQYQDLSKFDHLSTKDISMRIKRFKETQAQSNSDSEKEHLQEQIAEAAGGLVVIWINTNSEGEFKTKTQLLRDAYQKCKEALP